MFDIYLLFLFQSCHSCALFLTGGKRLVTHSIKEREKKKNKPRSTNPPILASKFFLFRPWFFSPYVSHIKKFLFDKKKNQTPSQEFQNAVIITIFNANFAISGLFLSLFLFKHSKNVTKHKIYCSIYNGVKFHKFQSSKNKRYLRF